MPRPSLSQHQGQFRGPYLSDFMVQAVSDLLNMDFQYQHKIVWVMDEECWYYRYDDNNSDGLNGWKAVTTPSRILEWTGNKSYTVGETVYYNSLDPSSPGKGIYVALLGTTIGLKPLDDPDHWLCISDDSRVISIQITNQTSFAYEAPSGRDIITKFFEQDEDGAYIEVVPETKYTILENNRMAYQFNFYEGYEDATYPSDIVTPIPHSFTGIIKILA